MNIYTIQYNLLSTTQLCSPAVHCGPEAAAAWCCDAHNRWSGLSRSGPGGGPAGQLKLPSVIFHPSVPVEL